MSYRNVTMIDELPDIDALENRNPHNLNEYNGEMGPPREILKMIRSPHKPMVQSGMMGSDQYNQIGYTHSGEDYGSVNMQPPQPPPQIQQQMPIPQFDALQISCIDIARHIQDCPICSKFYNNDKTVYTIAIIVLSIVCLLLMKRVLNI